MTVSPFRVRPVDARHTSGIFYARSLPEVYFAKLHITAPLKAALPNLSLTHRRTIVDYRNGRAAVFMPAHSDNPQW